jgi:uncharacterized membrane protein YvlD (DUF360 family)
MTNKRNVRRGPIRSILRVLFIWAVQAIFILFLAWLIPGVHFDSLAAAIVAVVVIALLSALLWPLLSYLTLPFMVLTLGLLALVLNALLILLDISQWAGVISRRREFSYYSEAYP